MKKILTGALAFVLFAGVAQAQTKDSSWHHKGGHEMGMKQLNLTADQQAKLKAIHEQERQEMKSLNTGSLTADQSKEQKQALHKKYRAQIESVLTPEQKAQMQKMHADHKGQKGKNGKDGKDFSKRGDFQKQLNLTQAQQDKMAELRKSSKSQFESIKNDKSLTDSQRKEKFHAIRKQQQEEMKSILTREQLEKMQSFRKDRKPETK